MFNVLKISVPFPSQFYDKTFLNWDFTYKENNVTVVGFRCVFTFQFNGISNTVEKQIGLSAL